MTEVEYANALNVRAVTCALGCVREIDSIVDDDDHGILARIRHDLLYLRMSFEEQATKDLVQ